MRSLFQNKYRIDSTRLKNWNYNDEAFYFVTICTENRIKYFGDIIDEKIVLSKIGLLVEKFWKEIPDHFESVRLNEFVIMPNHVHGIIEILNKPLDTLQNEYVETLHCNVSTMSKNNNFSKISPKSDSLSTIIRSFKSVCSKEIHKLGYHFKWQERFYDRIVRSNLELFRVKNYILENPKNWNKDKLFAN